MCFGDKFGCNCSDREFQHGDEVAWYADGDKIRSEYNPTTFFAFGKTSLLIVFLFMDDMLFANLIPRLSILFFVYLLAIEFHDFMQGMCNVFFGIPFFQNFPPCHA